MAHVLSPLRHGDRRGWLRGAPPPRWVRILPVALMAGVAAATTISHEPLDIGFLLGAIPPLAVLSYGPLATALLGGAAIVLLHIPALQLNRPGNTDLWTIAFVALLSVFVSFVRSRRDAELDLERTIAEAAQRALLPPLPEAVGPVRCTGLYRAAQRGALVGGDFYDVREGPYGVRAALGDVQGHGLAAIGTVASLLGAFREAVLDQPDLESVADRLERRLTVDTADARHVDLFATAVLLEFARDVRSVRVVACGHPPPVLLRAGTATEIGVEACTPLGLGLAGTAEHRGRTVRLEPGDRLFLASDGVLEARDPAGAFYPLTERLALLTRVDGRAPLPERVWADLLRHTRSIHDDITMPALAPGPPEQPGAPRDRVHEVPGTPLPGPARRAGT
ncbi:PP2C family protein-serine/threonine phosphatase [Streptomyces chromofuscus]|uniref:Serine/threonine-protein phosphatase n=1 Tax=Streptomyces chromofuscus TaxID=42881 RepID=A0A7M2T6Y6_STRCW|nr:PP2C family protein-serine/threonine phosphatase [Streptomyces chromofuscus]QOV44460.1 serine/threonine-protein phosphatase [Streptomyces chromofuscus]GGT16850.1 membrane protein [Streptomyces chromofuscus]